MRVAIIDDHELIREGLRRAFTKSGEFEVVADAGDLAGARRVLADSTPDVAVIDIGLPDGSGLDLVRELRRKSPHLGIVVLTMYAGDEQLFAALEAGASAFVPKKAPASDVVAAARHAAAAPQSFSAAELADAMRRRMSPSGPQLSKREREVLALLAEGLGIAQISKKLYISDSTTKTHVSKVYEKLGAANRAQALMAALRHGLLAGAGGGPH